MKKILTDLHELIELNNKINKRKEKSCTDYLSRKEKRDRDRDRETEREEKLHLLICNIRKARRKTRLFAASDFAHGTSTNGWHLATDHEKSCTRKVNDWRLVIN